MKIKTLQDVQDYLYQFIPPETLHQGELHIKRTRHYLNLLDNPQEKIKTVHIAGTSGKGSTSYLISCLLISHGFKVGLHISPHLVDIRERVQINNQLIALDRYIQYVNEFKDFLDSAPPSPDGQLLYFEVLAILTFYIVEKEKVDYLVLETFMGGLFDTTNCIDNPDKLVVLTRIGLDHTKILGETLPEIAAQKAGIIHPGNLVITLSQPTAVMKVFAQAAKKNKSVVWILKHGRNYHHIISTLQGNTFDYDFKMYSFTKLRCGLLGEFQVENCALAITAFLALMERASQKVDLPTIRKALRSANFSGRMQRVKIGNKQLIIDGAHNPQKVEALANPLIHLFPDQKFTFLLAFKLGKDLEQLLALIVPIANRIILTKFKAAAQIRILQNADIAELAETFKRFDFYNYQVIDDQTEAFKKALQSKDPIVVTGSLYFVADILTKTTNNSNSSQ